MNNRGRATNESPQKTINGICWAPTQLGLAAYASLLSSSKCGPTTGCCSQLTTEKWYNFKALGIIKVMSATVCLLTLDTSWYESSRERFRLTNKMTRRLWCVRNYSCFGLGFWFCSAAICSASASACCPESWARWEKQGLMRVQMLLQKGKLSSPSCPTTHRERRVQRWQAVLRTSMAVP